MYNQFPDSEISMIRRRVWCFYNMVMLYLKFWELLHIVFDNCYCRSAYCDAQLPPENLREFLPRLIPVNLITRIFFYNYFTMWGSDFEIYLSHLCRYCCQTWRTQMMMNRLLKPRFALGLISVCRWLSINSWYSSLYGFICLFFFSRKMVLNLIEIRSDWFWLSYWIFFSLTCF